MNSVRAVLAVAQAQALVDFVAAQTAAEVEMPYVCAEAEEAVTTARAEASGLTWLAC